MTGASDRLENLAALVSHFADRDRHDPGARFLGSRDCDDDIRDEGLDPPGMRVQPTRKAVSFVGTVLSALREPRR